jgi:hypothetical protein
VIFALREPPILLGLLLGFLVGIALRSTAQTWLARPRGLRMAGRARARRPWSAYLDPYGLVAAVLSGVGWGPKPEARRSGRSADWTMTLAAVGVHAALAAIGLAAFIAAGGLVLELHGISVASVLHGSLHGGTTGEKVALGFGMENLACGVLALVPIPPLEAGVVVWSRLPRSPGARRIAYHLLEEQWGVAILLVLLLLPLAGELPALLMLVNAVGNAILDAL